MYLHLYTYKFDMCTHTHTSHICVYDDTPRLERKARTIVRTRGYFRSWQGNRVMSHIWRGITRSHMTSDNTHSHMTHSHMTSDHTHSHMTSDTHSHSSVRHDSFIRDTTHSHSHMTSDTHSHMTHSYGTRLIRVITGHMWMRMSRVPYEWVVSYTWMSHVSHMKESRHTYESGLSHIWRVMSLWWHMWRIMSGMTKIFHVRSTVRATGRELVRECVV